MATPTVLVGGISHETNTFISEPTTREDFQRRAEFFGEDVIKKLSGTNTVIGGAVEAQKKDDGTIVPTLYAGATPGGTVKAETFDFYLSDLKDRVEARASAADGILLALHGAMVPEGGLDGEAKILAAIRDVVGDALPIVVALDLHGNISAEMLELTDGIVAYETYPHVDMADTGHRAMQLLLKQIRGKLTPVQHIEYPPVILAGPPQKTTGDSPMAQLTAHARSLEQRDGIEKINIFTGFHQADVPFMGPSIPVVGDDPTAVKRASRDVANRLWGLRDELITKAAQPAEAVTAATQKLATKDQSEGPIVMADLGDNPGAGSTADTTHVLHELISADIQNAGFALIRDPEAVAACIDAGVGARTRVSIGGKAHETSGEPVEAQVYVKRITDGKYSNTGPMGTGTTTDLGRTVLVECGSADGIKVILAEERRQPFDSEIWRHVGIQPERQDLLVVKSTNHFRAAHEPIASEIMSINSPGLSAEDPQFYDYKADLRDMVPLVSADEIKYPDWNASNST